MLPKIVICQTMTSAGDSNYEQEATDVNIHMSERVNVDMASAQQQRHTMARGLVGWLGCSMGVMVWFGMVRYGLVACGMAPVVMYGRVGELWFCRHSSLARGPTHISLTNNQKQASAQGHKSCHPKIHSNV